MEKILIIILTVLLSFFLLTSLAIAGPQSTTYEIKEWDFGSGGTGGVNSTSYSLFGNTGQLDSNSISSTTYKNLPGLTFMIMANVPPAPTFTNPSNYYNKLNLTLATGGNASDTKFAIAISPDAFSSTTKYVQVDDTIGSSPVWQTNTVWGSSGFNVVGLSPGTTYTVKVSAKQGNFTQSPYGPTSSAATSNSTFSFSISANSVNLGSLTPGSVITSSTVTTTVSTNGTGGAIIYASDSNNGLLSSNAGYTISSATADLSGVSQGYGLRGNSVSQSSGGPMEKLSPFNGTGDNVGLLDSTKRSIFDSTGAPVTSGQGIFELKAKASSTTKAASDYADTVTIISSATF